MSDRGTTGRRPRLEDVAAAIGMSPSSVSLALSERPGPSEETRRRVREAADRLGYRPDRTASLLARRRTRLLGVMLDIRSPFHAELVEDLHHASAGRGYELVLSTVTAERDERRAVETLLDFRCEALILLGPAGAIPHHQLPVVVIGKQSGSDFDVVRAADDLGVAQAVAHLVELGHRDITFIDGGKGPIAALRRRGYRTAMRDQGLADNLHIIPGGHDERAGARAAQALLDSGDLPTAVVASNDMCAVGLQDAFTRAGVQVPEDVSLVGYDNSTLARLAHIDLTSVDQDTTQLAKHAVEAAADRLENGRTTTEEFVLTPHLVVRGSTARPR
ncbi:LacI family DNA-binding transcriptional regulator [Kribbella sp. CA-245084]|uniref:LacI family DNA-binding transcriptional regulator n=1 Tax=Kribbella sp. CA-245084 TaxID=3239940 RepID=UPI003D93DA65